MSKLTKLPARGRIDIEKFTPNDYVLTVERSDGVSVSIHVTREDLKNLAEYIELLLKIEE